MIDEAGLRDALAHVRELGCTAIQLQWIDPGISVATIAAAVEDAGLTSVPVQDFTDAFLERPDYYLELNEHTQGTWLTLSRVPERFRTHEGLERFAELLEQIAAKARSHGQKLTFHPVAHDYDPVEGVVPPAFLMERIPELSLCLDLYHVFHAGLPLGDTIRTYAGRVPMVHFKDYELRPEPDMGVDDPGGSNKQKASTTEREVLVPAGQGAIDWNFAIDACLESGVRYGFVEQETWERDPFDCLGEAFAWLQGELMRRA